MFPVIRLDKKPFGMFPVIRLAKKLIRLEKKPFGMFPVIRLENQSFGIIRPFRLAKKLFG